MTTAPSSPLTRALGAEALSNPDLITLAQIIRQAQGDRNEHGEWVPGSETPFDIMVISEPLTGQDRELLEEGIRDAEGRRFLTLAQASAIRAGVADGDRLVYGGTTYQAIRVDDWGGFRLVLCVVPEAIAQDDADDP